MRRFIGIAKWLWLLIIAIGAAWYLATNFADVLSELKTISFWRVTFSFILLLLGRLLLVLLAQKSVQTVGFQLPLQEVFRMVAISELAKYLPGGIWHFLGRTGYYHSAGLSIVEASQSLILEVMWLIVSSALLGCFLLLLYSPTSYTAFLCLMLIVLWLFTMGISLRKSKQKPSLTYTLQLFLVQLGSWICLSLSFVVLLPAISVKVFYLTAGSFAISWLIGFLTVLAPGGIGTREAAITTLMLPLFPAETVFVLASIHRLLWICVEILMGVTGVWIGKQRTVSVSAE